MIQTVRMPPAIDQDGAVVTPTSSERDADRQQQRLQARPGEVDLLADGRDVSALERGS